MDAGVCPIVNFTHIFVINAIKFEFCSFIGVEKFFAFSFTCLFIVTIICTHYGTKLDKVFEFFCIL